MDIFLNNFSWMGINVALGLLAIVFGFGYLHSKALLLKIPLFLLWLLFLPNTIYLVTDLQYLSTQLTKVDLIGALALFVQYTVLTIIGVVSYFSALTPLHQIIRRQKIKKDMRNYIFLSLNFLIAFGVVLGKIERTHSWYIFTQPLRVVNDVSDLLSTPLFILTIVLFGLLFNLLYFSFNNKIYNLK